ncbi:hypothetical protein H0H87_002633 [Tephrocybe sp. NHM501043]|nr:hypothetical protein H0H87_002633 [Tephrocybe sp. NHM501043]
MGSTLYDLFPPVSIDPTTVSPLTASEFLQRILVPEIGARLIMQDMHMDGTEMDEAVKILRESATYGVAMFPADDGEGYDRDDEEMGEADMMLMKTAMRRRKELDADEKEEVEELERQMAEEAQRRKSKSQGKKKGKEKVEVKGPEQSPIRPPARPKPRPLGKGASTTSILDDVEMMFSEQAHVEQSSRPKYGRPQSRRLLRSGIQDRLIAGTTEVEKRGEPKETHRPQPRRKRAATVSWSADVYVEDTPLPSQTSQSKPQRLASQSNIDVDRIARDIEATPRRSRAPSRVASSTSVDVNLCSSSSDDTSDDQDDDQDWDMGRMKRDQKKSPSLGKNKGRSVASSNHDSIGQVDSSPAVTPSSHAPPRSVSRALTHSDSDEGTPRPARAQSRSVSYEVPDPVDVPPLLRARAKKEKSAK